MASETLTFPVVPPELTDAVDGPTAYYGLGLQFTVSEPVPCSGVDWWTPETNPSPPGGHYVSLWEVSPDIRVRHTAISPGSGAVERFPWSEGNIMLDPAKTYIIQAWTHHYTATTGASFPISSPSGIATATIGKLQDTGVDDIASSNFSSYYYVSPVLEVEDDVTLVSAQLDLRWIVAEAATPEPVSAQLDLRWNVSTLVSSQLDIRWNVSAFVSQTLDLRWTVESDTSEPLTRIRAAELRAQRRITHAFILADPYEIVLTRRTRTPNAAGGVTWGEPETLPAQTFRLLPQEDGATARTTAEGETATPEYVLLGEYNSNMERFDRFEYDGRRYEVIWISENQQYQKKGEVIHYG